ncbi:MAG: kelch repeat-containing protein [Acidimicrobiales bacterium]
MASRPLRPRQSYEARRRAARRAGHIRLGVLAGVVVVLIVVIVELSSGSSPAAKPPGRTTTSTTSTSGTRPPSGGTGVPAVTTELASWALNSALSRCVVLPAASAGSLIVAGGEEGSGTVGQGIFDVSTSDGAATQVGDLGSPLEDAAAVVLGGKGYVFGGSDGSAPVATAQQLANLGSTQPTTAVATSLGSLPEARAGDAATVIGNTVYVIGGDDGTTPVATVLATTDGVHFATVATLPKAVRDAAVAVAGGRIYVFGGLGASGDPVDTVQLIDPAAHRATVVGALPEPLAGAAAVTLGGVVYVAGGEAAAHAGATPSAVGTVWAWLATSSRAVPAGHLADPVAYAGVTVIGSTVWLIGGESAPSVLVRDVQSFATKPGTTVGGS